MSSGDVKLNMSSRGVEFDICMSSGVKRHQQHVIGECELPDMSSKGPVVVVHGGAWAVPDSLEVSFVSFFLHFCHQSSPPSHFKQK